MKTNNARKVHPLILAAAGAVLLFAAVGTAALMGWLPTTHGDQTAQVVDTKEPVKSAPSENKTTTHRVARTEQVVPRGDVGVVESVREVALKGEGTGLGAAIGGVAGGLAGHQLGGGHGKDAMTVVGVVGGGLAGHETEKRLRGTKEYEITVRFDDGTSKVYSRTAVPEFKAGDRVHVVDGDIRHV